MLPWESMENPSADTQRSDSEYNYLFRLELGFFEVLKIIARRTKIQLTIPETFIFGFGFPSPVMLCTDYRTGELRIHDSASKGSVYEACAIFEELTSRRGGLPIAVHKLASTTYFKDTATPLFSAEEAYSTWNKFISQNRAQILQRFVLAGFKYASLVKATWNGQKVKKQVFANSSSIVGHPLPDSQLDPNLDEVRRRCFVLRKTEGVKSWDLRIARNIDSKVMYLVSLMEKYYLPSSDFKVAFLEVDFMQDDKGVE